MKSKTVKQIILTADEGKYLTNGECYGQEIILPEGAFADDWYEITKEEYIERTKDVEEGEE